MARGQQILGVAILGHELSLTVIDDLGNVVFIAEEERYSRKKRGNFVFHPDLVLKVLSECKLEPEEIGILAVAGDPSSWSIEHQKITSFSPPARARHLNAWIEVYKSILPSVRDTIFLRHHRAHAASAFFAAPWDEAAVVTLDGYGDGEVATISKGSGSSVTLLNTQEFPHSLPYMYGAFARWLGLDGHEREGKLMALSAYGRPTLLSDLLTIISEPHGNRWLCSHHFRSIECKGEVWASMLAKILGPGRKPDEPLTQQHCDAAASMQELLELEMLTILRRAKELTNCANVCCAGGAFLNCRANGRLFRSGNFENYFFQPLAGDCGLSLGAALYASRQLGRPPWRMAHARLGSELDFEKAPNLAARAGVRARPIADVAAAAAQKLADGSIIAWCQGRAEVGPRSLCGRSLLADARVPSMRDRVNRIKTRELWRPFAPVMLEEETESLLGQSTCAPYMNLAFVVRLPGAIPAAVHVDATARVQTVERSADPLTWRLLDQFRELTNVGALLNTSLNSRGQPVTRTVEDCVKFFCESEIDALFLGHYLLEKNGKLPLIDRRCSFKSGVLPHDFVFAAVNADDGALGQVIDDLRKRAASVVHLAINNNFEIEVGDHLHRLRGQHVVLLVPSYVQVWITTMPRVLAFASAIEGQCLSLHLVDMIGTMVRSDSALNGLDIEQLSAEPLSDVEIHYLRSAKRRNRNKVRCAHIT